MPFGQLTPGERANIDQLQPTLAPMAGMVQKLHQQGDHRWLLIDLPDGYSPLTRSLIDVCDRTLVIVHPDGNSHIRLHQQALPVNSDILINDFARRQPAAGGFVSAVAGEPAPHSAGDYPS
ncbi:cellulose synthase [Klebsiella michiganensis]|nr:cellulose synthase [Klebsiella michiganensis]